MNSRNKKIVDAVLLSSKSAEGWDVVTERDEQTTIKFKELVDYIDDVAKKENISFYDAWEDIVQWKQSEYDTFAVLTGIIDDDD